MAATDHLSRLVAVLESSAAMYLADSGLATYPGPDEVRRGLADLAADHKRVLSRAAQVLDEREVAAPRTRYPLSYSAWHDVDLGWMLPRVVDGLRTQLGELDCIAAAPDDAAARDLAAEAAAATRRHLERLADLAARLRAGLAGQSA
ncbi:MAG: hypothetical protein ACKON7_09980 [Planctomycetaceae bacterium]